MLSTDLHAEVDFLLSELRACIETTARIKHTVEQQETSFIRCQICGVISAIRDGEPCPCCGVVVDKGKEEEK